MLNHRPGLLRRGSHDAISRRIVLVTTMLLALTIYSPAYAQTTSTFGYADTSITTKFNGYVSDLSSPDVTTRLVAIQKLWDIALLSNLHDDVKIALQAATADTNQKVSTMAADVLSKIE